MFRFGRGLVRDKLKLENWSREAKVQLIGSNRDVSLRVRGGFMHHPGQGCGGAGGDKADD